MSYPRGMMWLSRSRIPPFTSIIGQIERAWRCNLVIELHEEGGENNILHGDATSRGLPVGRSFEKSRALAGHAAHEHGVRFTSTARGPSFLAAACACLPSAPFP